VIPTTVLGLVVLAAALGPGYVFVRVEELRRPRPSRSTLLETAELIVIGGIASTTAVAVVASLAIHCAVLDQKQLAKDETTYVLTHVPRFAAFVLVTLGLSYGGAYLAARLMLRRLPPTIGLHSAWDHLFKPQDGIINYATVGLDDGLAISGDVVGFSVGDRPSEERELILGNPELRPPGEQTFRQAREPLVVVRGEHIRTVSVIPYEAVVPIADLQRRGRWPRRSF
jgi:hypothetical protein